MSRPIEFRGKRVDNGEWVYGSLLDYRKLTDRKGKTSILVCEGRLMEQWPVIPETVGQFTGLHDKNGKKVFEGDRVNWGFERDELIEEYRGSFGTFGRKGYENQYWCPICHVHSDDIEVIGTIHDKGEV